VVAVTVEETLATLRRRAASARAARDALAAAVRDRVADLVPRSPHRGSSSWLIGSLAWGGFGERSDVDVVVRGATPASACRLEVELTQAIRLPVDVLRLEDLPPSFQERVERDGLRLHGG
jgi:predicted nucleotidyltransferase